MMEAEIQSSFPLTWLVFPVEGLNLIHVSLSTSWNIKRLSLFITMAIAVFSCAIGHDGI